jgi:hypothetical protein
MQTSLIEFETSASTRTQPEFQSIEHKPELMQTRLQNCHSTSWTGLHAHTVAKLTTSIRKLKKKLLRDDEEKVTPSRYVMRHQGGKEV